MDKPTGRRPFAAEADGNRTRLGACAPTTVLKTAEPTRNPDASRSERKRTELRGISVWIMPKGQNGTTTTEILVLGAPNGSEVDTFSGVTATVDGADVECAPSTTNASTFCAWTGGDIAAFIGTRERDLHTALTQTEAIMKAIGA
jgi:hypothetical protein